MSFTAAVKSCMRSYATFRGRVSRKVFWSWTALALLATVAVGSVDDLAHLALDADDGGAFLIAIVVALLLPSLAVTVRRLHDTGRSGWWLLVPAVASFLVLFRNPAIGPSLPLVAAALLSVATLLVWTCLPGTPGANRFGLGSTADLAGVFGPDDAGVDAPAPADRARP